MTYILFNYYFGFNSSFSDGKKYLCLRPNSNPSTLLVWKGGGYTSKFVCLHVRYYIFGCSKMHSELALCEFCLHGIDFEITGTGSCQRASSFVSWLILKRVLFHQICFLEKHLWAATMILVICLFQYLSLIF